MNTKDNCNIFAVMNEYTTLKMSNLQPAASKLIGMSHEGTYKVVPVLY
jgi:hypothetical protein